MSLRDEVAEVIGRCAHIMTAEKLADRVIATMRKHEADREARLREALELIATPKRPDGTYNRCREACEALARAALEETKP